MATLVNIRIHTQSKAVPNANDITIEEVSLIGNTIIAKDDEGVAYELGVISAENIVVETPPAVSDCSSTTTNANIFATLVKGVDGVTPDMSDYYDKDVIDEKLGKKQDVVRDIETIRDGATKGATALQRSNVDGELKLGSRNPVQNTVVAVAVSQIGETMGMMYDMIGGIDEKVANKQDTIADLDAIREGASKGATAVQSSDVDSEVSETSTNPVQNKAVAGALNEIVGLLEATFSTVDERFKSKQDKLVSGENIKTINGESIIGEGNITIEGGGGGGGDLSGYATEEYVNNAVEAVNVKGEDGYVYSNSEKVDMRFTRSLIPVGTSIPAKANLNTVAYLKVGKYYCSLNADAKTITNCPTASAFMMEVFNPLSTVVDNEVDGTYIYRIRILTEYSTGIQYVQYCTVGSTANKWTYDSWYVCPRTKFTLNSSKNDGTAAIGSKAQGVYVDSTGTLQKMTYSLNKTVPANAAFTDTDTKVTAVGNHYTPAENADEALNAPEGEVVVGLKRDAAGHVVGVMSTPMSGGGGGGGIAVETDPIFSASPAVSITDEKMDEWDNKQDAIADLETIRSNASKGATAVQPGDIENVARLEEGYVVANGIVSKEDVYYHLPNTNTSDAAHTLATKGDLSSTIETYIADFTMGSLREGMINGSHVNCDMQALVAAMNANKIILVRDDADSSYKGVYVLNGYAEDLLYFSIVDIAGNVLYCDGTDYVYTKSYINGQALFFRSWDDKQDKLQSGENIKTINGESILGEGDMLVGKITYFSEEDRIELSPNVVWLRRGSVVNSVQITGFASNGKDYEEYAYHFYTGTIADGSAVKLILPKGVKYANKEIFDALESDTHYELSVVRSNGVVKAVLTAFK